MMRINDVTFAKGLRRNGKTGVNTTLNTVLVVCRETCTYSSSGAAFPGGNVATLSIDHYNDPAYL